MMMIADDNGSDNDNVMMMSVFDAAATVVCCCRSNATVVAWMIIIGHLHHDIKWYLAHYDINTAADDDKHISLNQMISVRINLEILLDAK